MLDVSLPLLPEPEAAGSARRWARRVLTGSTGEDTIDRVELVLTELVQNAVFHANTPMTAILGQSDSDDLCVAVADGSPVLPSSGLTDAEAMSGRGLLMVAAVAADWGAKADDDGKVVWARLPAGPASAEGEISVDALLEQWSDDGQTPLQLEDRAPLTVRDLPSSTMLAVKTHNDDVFRELTLCAMDDSSTGHEDVAHLARRAREVLATFADGRQQIRNQVLNAVHAGAAAFDLTLAVDDLALHVLGDYLRILDEADEWARRGLLLTEPPADDVLTMRRYYLTELLRQIPDR